MKTLAISHAALGAVFTLFSFHCSSTELFLKTDIDNDKNLHVYTDQGKDIIFKREPASADDSESEQLDFKQIKISSDHKSVGWVAMYHNCCTSYPIPMKLNVYTNKQLYVFEGTGLPIWDWRFITNGKQVSFHEETVHGGWGVHYEIREVSTNKLIKVFEPALDENNQPIENQPTPSWVRDLQADQSH